MLGRGVNAELDHVDPASVWGSLLPVLRSSDAVVANLECAITRHRRRWRRPPKVFHFRADPKAVHVLTVAGVRCVSLANNHSLDFEEAGLVETLELLDGAGIAYVGAGRDLEEARAPRVLDIGGVRVGFVGATDNEPHFAAGVDRPGTSYVEIDDSTTAWHRWGSTPGETGVFQATDIIGEAAAAARSNGAQVVILTLHWGPNMVTEPTDTFRTFAGAVLERGIDVLYGHSAHVFQGVERIDDKLVLYDTGDCIDDYAVDPDLRNDWSFVFLVDITARGRLEGLRLLPLRLDYARVGLAAGPEHRAICDLMQSRSSALGTSLARKRDGLELALDQ